MFGLYLACIATLQSFECFVLIVLLKSPDGHPSSIVTDVGFDFCLNLNK